MHVRTGLMVCVVMALSCKSKESEVIKTETVATCVAEAGCTFYSVALTRAEIDQLLNKNNFFAAAETGAVLVLVDCAPVIEEGQSLESIDRKYSGAGAAQFGEGFDFKQYVLDHGCFAFPNNTKRISFTANADGEAYTGYFFLNIKQGEAFMPNESFQAMAPLEGAVRVDAFMQHRVMKTYMVDPEGKKWVMDMPIGMTYGVSPEDVENLERFHRDFKKTGKRERFLQTALYAEEYTGTDDDGAQMNIWLVPATDVLLPPEEFACVGFFNVGYIQVNGVTYLMYKLTGSGFAIAVTGIEDGEYSFDPTGYTPFSVPGF
ncbi:hypothetical protein [Parapedobacter sp. 2B3]|uniref:hypothetical protein n=1 Tax=Parapedobacter sp. 2B3 TaxID=3342381 RepID=UPI0035B5840E